MDIMKILITGVKGFIGHHLFNFLTEEGHEVYGIDNCSGLGWEDREVPHSHCDITTDDLPHVDAKVVVHLAGRAGVRNSWKSKYLKEYYDINVKGTKRIFDTYKNSKILYASSSSVKDMKSPYAMTKAACEAMAPSNAIGMRFFTVWGPQSRPDMFYRQLQEGKIGYLTTHTRDWLYVKDCVKAIYLLMTETSVWKIFPKVFDIGYGTPKSVYDFAKENAPEDFDIDSIDFKNVTGESEETCADPTDIKKLGWEPSFPSDDFYVE